MTDATEVEDEVEARVVAMCELIAAQAADNVRLREALTMMVEDQCDYMNRNLLGDPEQQHIIKQARAALAATEANDD